ncbi:MerR family transcriptional regulator [Shouchella lehensis]|uniref:HTH-type, MerR family transcriptional regulator n=1 Tax=Shouchella lehensis G1 TaxID=1246626 RepID=A0A060LSR9_9BACI|nr:MerR family transcriptional regulator [Shouchella lehensis]AIC93172.1 HTH-type, MerR family transcriptional regulator [Shouchella lehensis G1]
MIRIGELANKIGVSKKTLYHYEGLGILKPSVINDKGYRYYNERAISRLQKILLLKSIGYTLKQIKILFDSEMHTDENQSWIDSLTDQVRIIEAEKDRLSRLQYYLNATIQVIKLKDDLRPQEMLDLLEDLNKRTLVNGVIPARFDEPLNITKEQKAILERLPVIGSDDPRLEKILSIFSEVRSIMHMEPNAVYVQEITHILYTEALKLFEGDEELMNLYWGLLTQPSDEEIVLGMRTEVTAFIDEMFYHYFDKKSNDERGKV